MVIPEKEFSVMIIVDLPHLPPVRGKLVLSQTSDKDSIKHLLGLQLWHLLKYTKLTEVSRQRNKLFIILRHKI